jgi:SpoVK/Ycf46/Vps4 family AAA+-type ATPase
MEQMRARLVNSYLFTGATGTGKSFHLKVIAKETSGFIYERTGQWLSRLVMADASTFYTPLFGETEGKINAFFDRLVTLGRTPLFDREGRPFRAPLIVVLEEADALFRARGEFGGSAHLFDRPLALMLQRMSSVAGELGVPATFIASSNVPGVIDPAALRRIGMRTVEFGSLSAEQAASVLDKKFAADLPLRDTDRFARPEEARQAAIGAVLSFLYGNDPDQAIAEVRMQNGERRTVRRADLVTPAQLEEAVSRAIDDALRQSDRAGRLLGVDADAVIRALDAQYRSLAGILRPHNLPEHMPRWFAGEPLRVESVRPLRAARRPRAVLFD